MADFAGHVAFFIGQEEPEVAIAADQALLFESGKAFLYPALERQFVGIDFIDAERGQVIDVRFDDVRDVANQEQGPQQLRIPRLKGRVVSGLIDAFRLFEQPERSFSWWDYRMLGFQKNQGLRIDHILLSAPLAARCTAAGIDREMRKRERPSDHAPAIAEIGPVA